ncbi:MAG: NAD(P)-binding domain-containing protein [Gammaproteobacteria bacterium]|nr:NAD(P)-binding domain-containing protein [Gammaproteobacteria bacterium]
MVIGAGHSGLSVSHCLSQRSIDHVVLEKSKIANAWSTERWDSLKLLTPNWQNVLPGYRYEGNDANGYMSTHQVTQFITDYAQRIQAPVHTDTEVLSVTEAPGGYQVHTNKGHWFCQSVVIANGVCRKPNIPSVAGKLPKEVQSYSPLSYKNPDQLPDGDVLVVGGSATGVQLAEEIQHSGRKVTLSVGEHLRMPRLYRGQDIQWWMDSAGFLDHKIEDQADTSRARRLPSPQLIGSTTQRSIDLNVLSASGVNIVGKLQQIRDQQALFSGSLRNCCAMADLKLNRLLDAFDQWATDTGMDISVSDKERFAPINIEKPNLKTTLGGHGIRTVIWATGYRPDYSWLHLPVVDAKGHLKHNKGVIESNGRAIQGLYAMGLPFMRRRKSGFIYGAAPDAEEITEHLEGYLASNRALALAS